MARASLERMGGRLEIGETAAGGVNARIVLPLTPAAGA